MIEPKDIEIDGKVYIISKFPATVGREIITKYISSSIPKIGDYKVNEEMMYKALNYVAIYHQGTQKPMQLSTPELINNHVKNWEILIKLEKEIIEYNCSFFLIGRISDLLKDCAQKAPVLISKMLTDLLVRLSQADKQHSMN